MHSMPLIPRRWISMSTTSGRSMGILCNASSALPYEPTQQSPGAPLSSVAKLARNSWFSSTKEILTGIGADCRSHVSPFTHSYDSEALARVLHLWVYNKGQGT